MTKALDAWLYDSINDAYDRATTELQEVFRPRATRGLGNPSQLEQDFLQSMENEIDRVIERYSRKMGEIFDSKPDTHSVAIISLESDKIRIVILEGLTSFRWSVAGRQRRDEIISKVSDDFRALQAILMQKLSRQNALNSSGSKRSKKAVASSAWTGKRSPREVATIIRMFGPSVLDGIDHLITAIENKRFNDDDVQKTLEEARMLHNALGELLKRADAGERRESILESFEHFRICALNVLSNRWAFFAASPVLTMGTVSALHGMSAQSFDGGAIATIWGGWVAAKLVSEKR